MLLLTQVATYLAWLVSSLAMLAVAITAYVWWTPGNELKMIREGNQAAAIALGGTVLGYAFVVYTATANNASILGAIKWSVIALIIQLIVFEVITRFVIPRRTWTDHLDAGDVAYGVTLGAFSLAAGVVSAGCLTS